MPFSKGGKYQAPKMAGGSKMNLPKPGRVGKMQPSPRATAKRARNRRPPIRPRS